MNSIHTVTLYVVMSIIILPSYLTQYFRVFSLLLLYPPKECRHLSSSKVTHMPTLFDVIKFGSYLLFRTSIILPVVFLLKMEVVGYCETPVHCHHSQWCHNLSVFCNGLLGLSSRWNISTLTIIQWGSIIIIHDFMWNILYRVRF
jgi:hypothetical protein